MRSTELFLVLEQAVGDEQGVVGGAEDEVFAGAGGLDFDVAIIKNSAKYAGPTAFDVFDVSKAKLGCLAGKQATLLDFYQVHVGDE